MGLFRKFKKGSSAPDWSGAYSASPRLYGSPDGASFGAIALTEGTKTILPKAPQEEYTSAGKPVSDWRLFLVSTTKDDVIGDCDYFDAMTKLSAHILDANEKSVLVKGLSLAELAALAE